LGSVCSRVQDDEDRPPASGCVTAIYKMIAFVLGGTFVGVAGGIYAYYVSFLNTSAVFDVVTSVSVVLAHCSDAVAGQPSGDPSSARSSSSRSPTIHPTEHWAAPMPAPSPPAFGGLLALSCCPAFAASYRPCRPLARRTRAAICPADGEPADVSRLDGGSAGP